jgi:hypothetical protein
MATSPVRVPDAVRGEVFAAARLLGCTPGELLAKAWQSFSTSAEFRHDFQVAQKAFATGDLNAIVDVFDQRGRERAAQSAARLRALREPAG